MTKIVYIYVNYTDSLKKNYIDIKRDKIQATYDFENEIKCIEKHKIEIVDIDYDLFSLVFQTRINKNDDIKKIYKNIDLVPYINLRPFQAICEKRGTKDNYKDWKITKLVIS